jgi:hypothetical protein
MPNREKNTENKDKVKAKEAKAHAITSKAQLKDVEVVNEILEQKTKVSTKGSLESTFTKIKLRNGTIKETYGERYGRPADGSE